MFQRCTIHIRQRNQVRANDVNWVEVKLHTPRPGAPPFKDEVMPTSTLRRDEEGFNAFRIMEAQVEGWLWWGRWSLGANSATQTVDSSYAVGTGHADARYWAYNIRTAEVHILQRSVESGWAEKPGGPATGYKVAYAPAVELWGATMGARGVKPLGGDASGGFVKIASRALRPERISWEAGFNA